MSAMGMVIVKIALFVPMHLRVTITPAMASMNPRKTGGDSLVRWLLRNLYAHDQNIRPVNCKMRGAKSIFNAAVFITGNILQWVRVC
jgi:hypothetical protein